MSSIPQSEARHEPHVDKSDWEYEYDDNETEDIYFTLDLTTYVPNAIQEKQYAKNGRLIGAADPEKNVQSDANAQLAPSGNDEDDGAANDAPAEISAPQDAGRLQILDLHTERPYVKYNNGFYSCHWFTDLGTQFWLTNPGAVRDPKFSGHVLDVVGSSQTRLVARPANLKRKRDDIDPAPTEGETATQSIAINDDAASDVSDAESRSNALDTEQDLTKPMVIPRQKIKDPHLEAQANFMERLSALKLKKGEKDAHSIPMKVPVYYKGARNADELRASHGVVRVEVEVDELQPATIPDVSRVSPAADNANADDAGEGAPANEDGAAPSPPRPGRRPRGSSRARRGGVVSNAARRSNLGLELADASSLPKKKRGRPSNAEKALRAQQAEAAALAASQQVAGPDSNTSFALDPQLGGGLTDAGASPATREVSAAPSSTQGDQAPPRKGRRSKAQLEEARRLEEERQARLSKAPSAAEERRESGDAAPGREQRPARKTRSLGAAEEFAAGNGTEDPQVEGEES